jgi:hypothetical protein
MRAAAVVLLSQLQATHATLQAALVQVGAQILALRAALELEGEEEIKCPTCGRTDAVPAGADGDGKPEYACRCGANLTAGEA